MLSVSNIFIIISFISTLIVLLFPELYVFGMNDIFLNEHNYLYFVIQIFMYSFIHGWFFHFFSNALFLMYFGNEVERFIWDKKYLLFFVFVTLSVCIWILLWWSGNTVGISWFCMALLTYYTLELYNRWNPDYRGWITAIGVNIAIGFMPWISLLGHFFWAISWFLFYQFNKKFLK